MVIEKIICASCLVPSEQVSTIDSKQYCAYCLENNLHTDCYCEHCLIVSITEGDKYCDMCASEIVDYLAECYTEQHAVERGLY